jgi:hypothetical protein
MYFLYSAQVVAAIVRSVPRASGASCPDQGMRLVDEQDDRPG